MFKLSSSQHDSIDRKNIEKFEFNSTSPLLCYHIILARIFGMKYYRLNEYDILFSHSQAKFVTLDVGFVKMLPFGVQSKYWGNLLKQYKSKMP